MEADSDYPTGDVGEHLEQSKEKRVSSYFTRWKEYTDRPQNHLHFIHNPGQVSTIYYDSSSEPSFLGADSLIDSYGEDIQQLIDSGANHRGYISTDYLFLKLQHSTNSSFGRILVIPHSIIEEYLCEITTTKPLSRGEHKTLLQLVCGMSLREAASIDSVSYETKRVQLKAISAKTKLKGQLEITNYVLTNLLYLLGEKSHLDKGNIDHSVFSHYSRNYLPDRIDTHIAISNDGQQHRFLTLGHEQGTPIILLHSLIPPFFEETVIDELVRHKLRLICPIRDGAIENVETGTGMADYFRNSLNSISEACCLFCNQHKVAIAAIGQSAPYAIEFSASNPDKVGQLIFIGAVPAPFMGILEISLRTTTPAYSSVANSLYNQRLSGVHHPQNTGPADLANNSGYGKHQNGIAPEQSSDKLCNAQQYLLSHSSQSIKQDIYHLAQANTNSIREVTQSLYFIHGEHDEIWPISDVRRYSKSMGALTYTVENTGHHLFDLETTACLKLIKSITLLSKFH